LKWQEQISIWAGNLYVPLPKILWEPQGVPEWLAGQIERCIIKWGYSSPQSGK